MIFAAGLGTRLKPLTDTRPKALVEIGGKTLLQRTIETLQRAGATRIVVNAHHFAGQVAAFVDGYASPGLELFVSDESGKLLDTGGGVKKAMPLFRPSEPVLIHNVDILSNADLPALYRSAVETGADATLLVSDRKTSRYLLFGGGMRLAGWTNVDTGQVKSPHEGLDPAAHRMLAFSGIHVISPSLAGRMAAWPDRFPIMDFYLGECAVARIVGTVQPGLELLDVGKPEALRKAAAWVAEH